jgi:hypothetical protein
MIRLSKSLLAWGTPEFEAVLKTEIESLDADQLPLQQGLSVSSHVADAKHTAIILNVADDDRMIRAKAGICYAGIIAGCSCADDPTPISENPEYCVVQLVIDKQTAATNIILISD